MLSKQVAGCTPATLRTYRWWLDRFAVAVSGPVNSCTCWSRTGGPQIGACSSAVARAAKIAWRSSVVPPRRVHVHRPPGAPAKVWATYKADGSRKGLLAEPAFNAEYERAKDRIRRIHVRYVHEPDSLRQALLEIYVAIAAKARYNDFDTH